MNELELNENAVIKKIVDEIEGLEFPPEWTGDDVLKYIVRKISRKYKWD